MGEVLDADLEHLRLLKIGFYVLAAMSGLGSLVALIFVGMGGFFASGVIPLQNASNGVDPRLIGLIFLAMGGAILFLAALFTFLTWRAGQNLEARRHRIFCMVMSGLWCTSVPFGTVVGVCALVVLSRPSVKALFAD